MEIKFDKTTLPSNNQRVKYRNLDTLEWKEGVYLEEDELFYTNSNEWEFAGMVDIWESLD